MAREKYEHGKQRTEGIRRDVFLRIPNIALRTEHRNPRLRISRNRVEPFDHFVKARHGDDTKHPKQRFT